jgi:uncharacterized membrane protein
LGFIFLAFFPGFLLLRAFRIEKPHLTEIIVYSAGLSLAFLMLIGLVINEFGLSGFLTAPLATDPLLIGINIVVACLCVISYFTNKNYRSFSSENW